MPVELVVPKVGESITEVEVGEWLKPAGSMAQRDETVVMLESEKATVELPAPVTGTVTRIVKQTGETAAIGEVIGYMEEGEVAVGASEAPVTTPDADVKAAEPQPEWERPGHDTQEDSATAGVAEPDARPEPQPANNGGQSAPPRVMPAAQRELAQQGLTPEQVTATGPGGRILKEDVVRATEQRAAAPAPPASAPPAPAPAVPTPKPAATPPAEKAAPRPEATPPRPAGEEEVVPMTFLRRKIAERLVEAQQTAALLTTFNEIDMAAVMALRKQHQDAFVKRYNTKLGFMSFFVKAAVDALRQVPQVNAEIRGKDIVYRNYYDIGVAIGSGKGLVVPVLRHAERMSFADIELAIGDLAKRAGENKLLPEELVGGTFTITNGGIYGSLLSTPIVNPPQSGILGMHAIQERPIAHEGQVVIRPMMYIALTYDHRIIDGREAVTFLKRIKECIEEPSRMLVEV